MIMHLSAEGLVFTAQAESCRLAAYQDVVGVWTIGYGHTRGVTTGQTCTPDQALAWLLEDAQEAITAVNRLVTVPLTQGQFDALVDFVFNLGEGALAGSTLLRLLNAGDSVGAAAQFPRWDHAGGVEVAGLLTRRQSEAAMFRGVESPPEGSTA